MIARSLARGLGIEDRGMCSARSIGIADPVASAPPLRDYSGE